MSTPPSVQLQQDAALVVVDVQVGFDAPGWGRRDNPDADRNIEALVQAFDRNGPDAGTTRPSSCGR